MSIGSRIEEQSLSLPQGGGGIRGLGESFQPSTFSGTGDLTIPLQLTPGRAGAPELALAYNSGSGNGPFGLGFSLDLPSVARTTRLRIPRYDDTDAFTYAGADLVPRLVREGDGWVPDEYTVALDGTEWRVRRYVPRVAALPARVERWTAVDDGRTQWKVVSAENTATWFGRDADARVADPGDPARVLAWLLDETLDRLGNRALYRWKPEDGVGISDVLWEADRGRRGQRYLHSVRYGNYRPDAGEDEAFALEAVLDYGEYDLTGIDRPGATPYTPVRPWPVRQDPFSTYRPGWELRTYRLCRGVLMFHHLPDELGAEPCLAGATLLEHERTPTFSFVRGVSRVGYRRGEDGSYAREAMPPVTFSYSRFAPPEAPVFRTLQVPRASDLPGYLSTFQPVDLDGEGLPGILYRDGTSTLYYPPLGGGLYAAPEAPATFPVAATLPDGAFSLRDLDADGRLEVVVQTESLQGFFAHRRGGGWDPFQPFETAPALAPAGVQAADLAGDGRADLLTFGGGALEYYPSEGTRGYGAPQRRTLAPGFPAHEDAGEQVLVAFADVFGDGLPHRVTVRDGSVRVWPSLGYGRFGPPVALGNAPRLGGTTVRRIYLADVDGSGTADLVFAYTDRVEIHRNQSGNSFAPPLVVRLPDRFDDSAEITFTDVLGQGATALVFTRADPVVRHWFLDFDGTDPEAPPERRDAPRPYLLTGADNHMGGTTELRYASSTGFYLRDRREGRPWPTRLPFPVQVVEQVTTADAVSGTRATRRFVYHDGYYDPVEREFNGFGYVEAWDTEAFEEIPAVDPDSPAGRLDRALYVPPAYTRTWFLTGAYEEAGAIDAAYRHEYFAGDPLAYRMPGTWMDDALRGADARTLRDAHRALKGRQVHQEVYGLDGGTRAEVPYTVEEACWQVEVLQPARGASAPAFAVRERESIACDYERDAADPRVSHEFLLASTLFDPDGVEEYREERCTVLYPRRPAPGRDVYPEQAVLRATAAVHRLTRVTEPFFLVGSPLQSEELELAGVHTEGSPYLSWDQAYQQVGAALENRVPYGAPFTPGATQARPYGREQAYYWNLEQTEALPLGRVSPRALLHHARTAVFTDDWLAETYGGRVDEALLAGEGGYLRTEDGYWWNRGLVRHYATDPGLYHLAVETANDFAEGVPPGPEGLRARTTVAWDAPYALRVVEVGEVLDATTSLTTTAAIDYQTVRPWRLVDPNGVVSQARFDPLGRVVATSLFHPAEGGRPREGDGDLAAWVPLPATFDEVLADKPRYLQQATTCFFYDAWAWEEGSAAGAPQPASTVALARQVRVSDLPPGVEGPIEAVVSFTGGAGRVVEEKREAEPGEAVLHGAGGGTAGTGPVERRWIVSGRTVYNNKGAPAQQYLAYYSDTPRYERQAEIVDGALVPPPTVTHYDPLLRPVRVDTPQGFFSAVTRTAWQEAAYDPNDTVRDSEYWRTHVDDPLLPAAERDALEKAARCYNTPALTVIDNAAAPIRRISDNLGSVAPDAFEAVVAGSGVTSRALWDDLVARGYLETRVEPPAGTWLTPRFRPYDPGFALELDPAYQPFAPAVTEQLRQGVLATLVAADVRGREVETADPRLFYAAVRTGADARSFRYAYPMTGDAPAAVQSADAGPSWTLADVLGSGIRAWDGRGYEVRRRYDALQRLAAVEVRDPGGGVKETESVTYGEGERDAAARNLRGQVYRWRDQAGVLVHEAYGLQDRVVHATRRFRVEAAGEPDWRGEVPLEEKVYHTRWRWDAMERVVAETVDDGATVETGYHLSGRTATVRVVDEDGAVQPVVADVGYTAAGQRQRVAYGNGIVQRFTYQFDTQRLVGLRATRPTAGTPRSAALQDVTVTYDPVGNATRVVDGTAETVFCYNQQVEAKDDYTYDLLYRLVRAGGRQHPGIQADTHLTGFKQSRFASLCPPDPADQVKLERYTERYAYDDSGNLLTTRHQAASASFTRDNPVRADSDRLQDVAYDGSGNPLQLALLNTVGLAWDSRGQLAETTIIQRPEGDDRAVFGYDHAGSRVRRVVERVGQGGTVTEVEDRVYVGSYQVTRTVQRSSGGGERLLVERTTLRVMDDTACAAILDRWTEDLAGRQARTGERRMRFQLPDRLGSVSVETDGDAAVISYEVYFPYGGTALVAGPDRVEVAPKEYRYTGKECDDATGLYYYGARYYATWTGRWLSPDPSGAEDGLNLYAYVSGNPTSYVDGDGRVKESADGTGTPAAPPQRPQQQRQPNPFPGVVFRDRWAGWFLAGRPYPVIRQPRRDSPPLLGTEARYSISKVLKGFAVMMANANAVAESAPHSHGGHGEGHGGGHAPTSSAASAVTTTTTTTTNTTRAAQFATRFWKSVQPYVGTAHSVAGTSAVVGGVAGGVAAGLDMTVHGVNLKNSLNLTGGILFGGEGLAIFAGRSVLAGILGTGADTAKAVAAYKAGDPYQAVSYTLFAAGNLASTGLVRALPRPLQVVFLVNGVTVSAFGIFKSTMQASLKPSPSSRPGSSDQRRI